MCQFNLVLVKDIKNKQILENNDYWAFKGNINGFTPFVRGLCNCGSFVGTMCDYDGSSYLEMMEEEAKNNDEIEPIDILENSYEDNYNDFLEYIKLFKDLLENEEHIGFCYIESEPGEMSIEKEININDITIEDLASLECDKILKIYR